MKAPFFDPAVRCLLVDLDGTLLGNRQLPLSVDFVKRSLSALRKFGGWRKSVDTLVAIQRELLRPSLEATNDVRVVELVSRKLGMTPDRSRQFLRETISAIFPELKRHFYPIPGSREFLEWASPRYPMILATTPVWPQEIIELRVRWAGVDPAIFRSITHVRRMHAAKPNPEYFQEILDQEGLSPEHCLLIGDDRKMDLPATRVGIRVFIVSDEKKSPKLERLKPSKSKAEAWAGNYRLLKEALSGSPNSSQTPDAPGP